MPRIAPVLVVLSLVVGLLPGLFAGEAHADTVSAAAMLQRLNELRHATGAPTIQADPRVVLAAQRHADYNSMNGVSGHYETPGLPGYSGYSAKDRVAAAGWNTSWVSEVAATYRGALYALEELWHAPYHRIGMMHPNTFTAGWGHSDINGNSNTVGNLVKDFSLRPVEFVRSPAHGQTGIPPSWSGNESPSPLPAGASRPVGYPVMIAYSAYQRVELRGAEIVGPEGKVALYFPAALWSTDYQFVIPKSPLASGTTYHVRFDLTIDGRWLTNEWDFTTQGAAAAALPSPDNGFHAQWVDQTASPVLPAGTTGSVTVRFKNTGTKTWQRGVAGSQANLGIVGDRTDFAALGMSVDWPSADRVAVQSEASVAPGAIATFTFQVRAPAQAGTYRIPLRPVIDGVTWLEDYGVYVDVASRADYHSRWHSQSAYPVLSPGELSPVLFVRFTNTGGQSWVKGTLGQEARLGINGDDRSWATLGVGWPLPDRVAAQDDTLVAPGAVGTFSFQVRAPSTPGEYRIHLRPVIDGTTWMEDDGVWLLITVR
ncbi:MAG: CAP domain-containing protein [Candidatus Limnocylindria bacterium]